MKKKLREAEKKRKERKARVNGSSPICLTFALLATDSLELK